MMLKIYSKRGPGHKRSHRSIGSLLPKYLDSQILSHIDTQDSSTEQELMLLAE